MRLRDVCEERRFVSSGKLQMYWTPFREPGWYIDCRRNQHVSCPRTRNMLITATVNVPPGLSERRPIHLQLARRHETALLANIAQPHFRKLAKSSTAKTDRKSVV